jgi:hypothetical protein
MTYQSRTPKSAELGHSIKIRNDSISYTNSGSKTADHSDNLQRSYRPQGDLEGGGTIGKGLSFRRHVERNVESNV